MMTAFFSVGLLLLSGFLTRRKESTESTEAEFVMEPAFEEPERAAVSPVFTPMPTPNSMPSSNPTAYTVPVSNSAPTTGAVDPLTLDAKTRYRMMQSQNRYSNHARSNLWGSGNGSPYGGSSYSAGRPAGQDREQSMDF